MFLDDPRYSQTTCHAKYHPILPHIQCVQRAKVENADNADRTQWPQLKIIFHLSRPSQTLCLDRNVSPSFTDKSPFRCFGSSDVSIHHQLGCKDSRSVISRPSGLTQKTAAIWFSLPPYVLYTSSESAPVRHHYSHCGWSMLDF